MGACARAPHGETEVVFRSRAATPAVHRLGAASGRLWRGLEGGAQLWPLSGSGFFQPLSPGTPCSEPVWVTG